MKLLKTTLSMLTMLATAAMLLAAPARAGYSIKGVTYHPMSKAQASKFQETGKATWYGGHFHGRKAANGSRYDVNGLTAAHKTLPFGTKVKVTNKANGKSVVVTITDRGPFAAGKIIDLTPRAFNAIGHTSSGVLNVHLKVVS